MEEKKITRLILKDDDILIVKVPSNWFHHREVCIKLYERIKKQLLPRKNKILMLPSEIEISVLGSKEINEYVSNIDLWELWEE